MEKNIESSKERFIFTLVCAVASVLLSLFTVVLAAIPLHAWYRREGKKSYLIGTLSIIVVAMALGWEMFALPFLAVSFLIWVFNYVDNWSGSLSGKGLIAVVSTAILVFAAVTIASNAGFLNLETTFEKPVNEFVDRVQEMSTSANGASGAGSEKIVLSAKDILNQIPSGVIIVLMASLFLALLFELRYSAYFSAGNGVSSVAKRSFEFLNFRVPNVFVWLIIAALLFSFLKASWVTEDMRVVGVNILNVLLAGYFLQGLAIATVFFQTYQVGRFWRTLLYVMFVLQMFLFVSCIGVVDYWFDFRTKLLKKTIDTKINNKGGSI